MSCCEFVVTFKLDLEYITKIFQLQLCFLISESQTFTLVYLQKEYMHSTGRKIGNPKAETQKSALKCGVPSTGSPLKFHGLLIFFIQCSL